MEKICTRCQFRNPSARRVCQVCGFAKFQGASTQPVAVDNQPTASISKLFNQTIAAATAAVEKIADTHKHADAQQTPKLDVVPRSTMSVTETTFETNDLDSMMAWFKSYGVDKPLILENKKTAA